jgi:hypothetical protein
MVYNLFKYPQELINPARNCDYGPKTERVPSILKCRTLLLLYSKYRHIAEVWAMFLFKMRNIQKIGKSERNFFDFSVNRPQTLRGQFWPSAVDF